MARKKFDGDDDGLVDRIDRILSRGKSLLPVSYWLPTGCDLLDWSVGGGLPGGRLTEIVGPESSGKSLIALSAAKQALRAGGFVWYFDTEASITPQRCKDLGLPEEETEHFIPRQPDSMEEALDCIEQVAAGSVNLPVPTLIVLDSVAASVASESGMDSKKTMVKDVPRIGGEAGLLAWFFKRGVLRRINGTQVVILFVNQLRSVIGGFGFGEESTETSPGGRALRFYASLRIKVKRLKMMKPSKEGAKPAGAFLITKVIKSKIATPYLTSDFPIFFKTGVDNALGLIYYLEQQKALKKPTDQTVEFEGKKYTRAALRAEMKAHAEVYEAVRKLAREHFNKEP